MTLEFVFFVTAPVWLFGSALWVLHRIDSRRRAEEKKAAQ